MQSCSLPVSFLVQPHPSTLLDRCSVQRSPRPPSPSGASLKPVFYLENPSSSSRHTTTKPDRRLFVFSALFYPNPQDSTDACALRLETHLPHSRSNLSWIKCWWDFTRQKYGTFHCQPASCCTRLSSVSHTANPGVGFGSQITSPLSSN